MFLKLTSILPRVDEWADKMDRYEEIERENAVLKSENDKVKSENDKVKSENEKMAKVIEELKAKLEAKRD